MALPNVTTLKQMDYSYKGMPFVEIPAKTGIDLSLMDFAYLAMPFVRNDDFPAVATLAYCWGAIF